MEEYEVTEEKPDGSEETYQMRVNRLGVTFICEGGQETFVPFGEPAPLVFLVKKPVIYFYSKKKRKVKVKVNFKGKVSFVYPKTGKDLSWELEIKDEKIFYRRKEYPYLFWDGQYHIGDVDFKEGFIVKGEKLSDFLEEKLSYLGLNQKEITDFITYWLSSLSDSPWVYIKFDKEIYQNIANLKIMPAPDKIIRVFVIFRKLKRKIAVKPQKLDREDFSLREKLNFVVVDWGGVLL